MARGVTERCNALKADGTWCHQQPGWGTSHPGVGKCRWHLGNTANVIKSAQDQMARLEVANLGLPQDVHPHEALLFCVRSAYSIVTWLQAKIQSMDDEQELTQTVHGPEGPMKIERSIWVEMYQDALSDLARFSKLALDAGVEERQVRIAEKQARAMTSLVEAIFDRLEVAPRARARIVQEVMAELPETAGYLVDHADAS